MTVVPNDPATTAALEAVRGAGGPIPEVAIVMGSGLGQAVEGIEADAEISFGDIPGFPVPTVPGHDGRLMLGRISGVAVAAFLGRVHYYEGHPMSLVTLPTRLAAALGAKTLISTGAVGGIDSQLEAGSLVVGTDHLNFIGENPLRGWTDSEGRPPFVDLTNAYAPELAELALSCASELGIPAASGVYAAMPGPSYETPSEIEFLKRSGATVVGMSVVPEALASAALGMRFGGLFCVTNLVGVGPVDHADVTRAARLFSGRLSELFDMMIPKL
ncbi:MAG: purine-nucleoside phosphorylase [Actinomycetota bacterium]